MEKKEQSLLFKFLSNNVGILLFFCVLFLGLLASTCQKNVLEYTGKAATERDGKGNITLMVPQFYQWDDTWGYEPYGYGTIADSGCGPTCLSMVTVYYTGNTKKTPDWMAKYSTNHGHVMGGKTAWTLMSEGAQDLGLHVAQVPIKEKDMKKQIKKGHPMICSMRPGDFTRGGHFIVLTGYRKGKYEVHDPNSAENSKKTWSFSRLQWQIKNVWAYWK